MTRPRFLLIVMTILPWFSFPFLGRKTVKRFLLATIFTLAVVKIGGIIAKKREWWIFHTDISSKISGNTALAIGPYFIVTLWILKWTFGKPLLYIVVNSIGHVLYAFPGMELLKRLGIVSYKRINSFQFLLIHQFRAALLYGFQILVEKIKPCSK